MLRLYGYIGLDANDDLESLIDKYDFDYINELVKRVYDFSVKYYLTSDTEYIFTGDMYNIEFDIDE